MYDLIGEVNEAKQIEQRENELKNKKDMQEGSSG